MKISFLDISLIILFAALIISCEMLPFKNSSKQSWLFSNIAEESADSSAEKKLATLTIKNIQIDRIGGWESIEKEASSLAPLYFWDKGYRVVSADEQPDYSAVIKIIERDFNQGWRSKKSLSVEVHIYSQKNPVAVGRVVRIGEKSFSSSQTLGIMLSAAIKKAVNELSSQGK